jgi:hypothetical protein
MFYATFPERYRLGNFDGEAVLSERGVPTFACLPRVLWIYPVSERKASVDVVDERED